jgi:hypothetical protein
LARDGFRIAIRRQAVRISLFIAMLATVTLVASSVTFAARAPLAHALSQRAANRAPLQGVYEYCAPANSADGCLGRLRQIAAGGFGAVLNYAVFDSDQAQLERYIGAAVHLRIKLIWPMDDSPWWGNQSLTAAYPKLAAGCDCQGRNAFVKYVVDLVRRSPATWGYYMADEQPPQDAAKVVKFSHQLHALDPHHPRLAIAVGDDDVTRLLHPYAAAADVVGADTYPIGTGQPISRVDKIARGVASVAHATHRKSAMVLQSFDWSAYPDALTAPSARWPTRREMREMRDLAIRYADPSLILWYSYFDITNSAAPSKHWHDLLWAAFGK